MSETKPTNSFNGTDLPAALDMISTLVDARCNDERSNCADLERAEDMTMRSVLGEKGLFPGDEMNAFSSKWYHAIHAMCVFAGSFDTLPGELDLAIIYVELLQLRDMLQFEHLARLEFLGRDAHPESEMLEGFFTSLLGSIDRRWPELPIEDVSPTVFMEAVGDSRGRPTTSGWQPELSRPERAHDEDFEYLTPPTALYDLVSLACETEHRSRDEQRSLLFAALGLDDAESGPRYWVEKACATWKAGDNGQEDRVVLRRISAELLEQLANE